jgi:hypothetical protein
MMRSTTAADEESSTFKLIRKIKKLTLTFGKMALVFKSIFYLVQSSGSGNIAGG